jgi:class 3 adenylate cyclase
VHIGALVVLAFYNLFLFVSLKSKVYLYYVAYLIPFIAVQLIFTGQADLLLPETEWRVWFLNEGLHFSIKLALGFSVLFTLNFLKMASYHRSGSLILRGMAFILFVSVLATFLIPYRLDSMFVALTTVISSFILIGCGIIATYRGFRPALYYSAAWFFLLLGSSVVALKAYGVLPINLFTTWAQLTGSTLEGVLLSLALGERFNTFQRQATRERESYIARLEAKEKENRHSYQQLAKIVYPHQLKMIKEGSALEQTMPTGESEAVVICFDTVASSRLDPNYSRTFMSEVFQRCYDRMYEDYDMLAQTSSAYRIKEMGDGFLCSVGFPLPMTQSASPATLAFELAIAFTEIFDQVAENYPFASPPHCSIGIASGQVEAFYPVAGVREYDLYGPAIILADRYESLRKVVFGPWLSNNIGVLSESVYDQLDATSKEILMGYNLTDHGIQVRDDEGAKWFHYCFVKLGKIGSKLTNDKGYGQPA